MTENGIILNNEMADFSIPGVTKIDGAGPPKVSTKYSTIRIEVLLAIFIDVYQSMTQAIVFTSSLMCN